MATKTMNGNGNDNGDREYGAPAYSTPDVLTTSKGAKIKFIGLNPARLETLQNSGKMPPVPMREIANDLGGPPQKEFISAADLQNDEERAQWQDYLEKRSAVEKKRNENVMKYVFNEGFQIDDSEIEAWKQEEEEEYGIELPTSRLQLRMDFINAKVVGNAEDLGNIMAGVMERTGVPADKLDEVRDSFRGTVRQNTAAEAHAEQVTAG